MPITLRQLRYFQALVEHGSFSRAAESVFVSQPALSLQIRELEATLGGPLVERESRGVHLTRLGREAHEQTLRILDETNFLELMGKQFDDGRAPVTVGIISTLSPYLLPGLLERLQETSPHIEPGVVEATGNELIAGLQSGRLDAAVLSLPLGMIELPERELFEDRFLVAGRPGPIDAVRPHAGNPRPEDLARADIGPLLTLADGHCLADQVLGPARCGASRMSIAAPVRLPRWRGWSRAARALRSFPKPPCPAKARCLPASVSCVSPRRSRCGGSG